jgi:hypothetical protein
MTEYPEQAARLEMLQLLHRLITEGREQGTTSGGKLWLFYMPPQSGPGQLKTQEPGHDIAGELGWSVEEAYGRLWDLRDGGLINIHGSAEHSPGVTLTDLGRIAIGNLPNPQEKLLAIFDAMEAAVDGAEDASPDEREQARQNVGAIKNFLLSTASNVSGETIMRLVDTISRQVGS